MVLLACAVAYANEAAGHAAEHGAEGLPWKNFGLRVLNFVIVVGIIWKFAGKAIGDFFRGRQDKIRQDLSDLETRRRDAEAKLKDVEKGIANLETEKAKILADARAQGEAMKAGIVAEAEKKAEQIKTAAETAAVAERKAMVDQIRSEVADMVVEAAEAMIKEKLTAEDHQKLVDKYITKVVLN
ncbi:F0F1 ATP synthase subunit B [Desulfovibrio sp. X2]|uniref:F0F1 ATP synthase subunit B n=1 Tax=Desulfovibrio sp. X2 TaxID=941449 RepID=UPI00068DFE1A|nr:F0F1 ATP synthase subunit B [Desulfovibrio sp. X2]